jgi:Predicted ester cyclase
MSIEANKALARRIVDEMWNTRNLNVINEVYAPQFGGGHAAARKFVEANLAAFPDLQITIHDQIAEDDLVTTRYSMRATHQGEIANIPPTGKQFEVTGIEMHRFAEGKLIELWNIVDMLGILQQVGIIPSGTK